MITYLHIEVVNDIRWHTDFHPLASISSLGSTLHLDTLTNTKCKVYSRIIWKVDLEKNSHSKNWLLEWGLLCWSLIGQGCNAAGISWKKIIKQFGCLHLAWNIHSGIFTLNACLPYNFFVLPMTPKIYLDAINHLSKINIIIWVIQNFFIILVFEVFISNTHDIQCIHFFIKSTVLNKIQF